MRLALALVVALVLAAPAVAHEPPPDVAPLQTGPLANDKGAFSVPCGFSHRSKDDPIVFPGVPGAAHSHDFLGATTTNASSTPASIRAGTTTCRRPDSATKDADRAAYWVPTLYVNDVAITPSQMTVDYKTGSRYMQAIRAFPENFQMIAGTSTGGPQEVSGGLRIWWFECNDRTTAWTSPVPTCEGDLRMDIRFPDCSNGALDAPDHKAHMAYSQRIAGGIDVCPASHPFLRPKLALHIRYATRAGPTTRLASGAPNTAHADFMNGWIQDRLVALTANCVARDIYCGGGDTPV